MKKSLAICLLLLGCADKGAISESNPQATQTKQEVVNPDSSCFEYKVNAWSEINDIDPSLVFSQFEAVISPTQKEIRVRYQYNPNDSHVLIDTLNIVYHRVETNDRDFREFSYACAKVETGNPESPEFICRSENEPFQRMEFVDRSEADAKYVLWRIDINEGQTSLSNVDPNGTEIDCRNDTDSVRSYEMEFPHVYLKEI